MILDYIASCLATLVMAILMELIYVILFVIAIAALLYDLCTELRISRSICSRVVSLATYLIPCQNQYLRYAISSTIQIPRYMWNSITYYSQIFPFTWRMICSTQDLLLRFIQLIRQAVHVITNIRTFQLERLSVEANYNWDQNNHLYVYGYWP